MKTLDGWTYHTDPETRETVFEKDGDECRIKAESGAETVRLFREWRKANGK